MTIEPLAPSDWDAVRRIYLEGIATGNATFATAAPEWEEWDQSHLACCRLVARVEDQVIGWVALGPVSRRSVYAGVAEVSVYVASGARGQGLGKRLLEALVEASEREGIWTLQAGIFAENAASIAAHHGAGFRLVGVRERIGQMNGRWRDVLLLERRSSLAGQ